MSKNTITKFEIFTDQDNIDLTGRLLGLIKEEDLFPLLNNRTFQRKIFSKATLSILELAKAIDNKNENTSIRLVATVKKISGKTISQRTLFISDKLDFVSKLISSAEIAINGLDDTYMFVKEIKNNEKACDEDG
jgi:hypothetical protein